MSTTKKTAISNNGIIIEHTAAIDPDIFSQELVDQIRTKRKVNFGLWAFACMSSAVPDASRINMLP